MKKISSFGFAALLATAIPGTGHALPSEPLFIVDSSGSIGTVNLGTGAVTVIGNSGVQLTDIAFTADGSFYGSSFDSLYSVNRTTGAATLVSGYGGIDTMNALVGYGNSLLAASYADTTLHSLTVGPFSITPYSGALSGTSGGDLAFAGDGSSLYEALGSNHLAGITLSGTSLSSSVVGDMGLSVMGLATGDDGLTYAISGTSVYSVNTSTGALTFLIDYGGQGLDTAYGAAFGSEGLIGESTISEPASIMLLGLALLGLGTTRRKR